MAGKNLNEAYIYSGGRSAFGRHGGALSSVRPDDLLAHVIKSVVENSGFTPETFEDIVMGNTNGAGEDCRNVARFAALRAGMPTAVAGITVNCIECHGAINQWSLNGRTSDLYWRKLNFRIKRSEI